METKRTFRIFTIFQYKEEQDYLREMHLSGWKFVKVSGPCIYYFEKCVPEDVIYQLDYNKDGIAHKEEYVKVFSDCGWEYLQDYAGYSYFRKSASETEGAEEIFCDDDSRQQMMMRVCKGRLVPVVLTLPIMWIPYFILFIYCLRTGAEWARCFLILSTGLICLYALLMIMLACQYRKLKKREF